eukprot:5318063-Prymnesium_polylepis.2
MASYRSPLTARFGHQQGMHMHTQEDARAGPTSSSPGHKTRHPQKRPVRYSASTLAHTATPPERPCATATVSSTSRNLKKGSSVTRARSKGTGAPASPAASGDVDQSAADDGSASSDHSFSSEPN